MDGLNGLLLPGYGGRLYWSPCNALKVKESVHI